jgi:PilZ domain
MGWEVHPRSALTVMSHSPSPTGPWHSGMAGAVPIGGEGAAVRGPEVPPPFEPRAYPRFRPRREMLCRVRTVTGGAMLTARVQNISRSGLGLLADQPLAPGTCALVELSSASGLFMRTVLLHLIHVADHPDGHLLGGEFLGPLNSAELNLLLA